MNPETIKARGPWVLVKVEPLPEKTESGIYIPDGNSMERLGHRSAEVVSVAESYTEKDEKGRVKKCYHELKKGDRVVFRGHLKEANTFSLPKDFCMIHVKDLVGVLGKDQNLDMALPYDN